MRFKNSFMPCVHKHSCLEKLSFRFLSQTHCFSYNGNILKDTKKIELNIFISSEGLHLLQSLNSSSSWINSFTIHHAQLT